MWLKLTFIFLQPVKGKPKESMSVVQQQRLNFDKVVAYFEANPEQMNNPSENARFNTVIDIGDPKVCFWVKETVEQIDDMLGINVIKTSLVEGIVTKKISNEPENSSWQ